MTTPSRPDLPGGARPTGATGAAQWVGQVVLYGLFALAIGVFSQWPPYHPIRSDQAVIKISVTRLGQPVGECRRLSQDELAKLPPNMRDPVQCPRERAPLSMEVDVGGKRVLQRVAQPTGLSKDGSASIYERLVVAAGPQQIEVRFKDDVRPGATTYHRQASVDLVPGQVLVVDFDAEKGGITLQ
ncbi:MAG TPA: hypothetical protein PKD71_10345 [Ottowia sp.]|nr:hypothetical protein [Ottowia sp.]